MPDEPDTTLPTAAESITSLDRPTAFFNALMTEHFVLESARSITVSESSSRSSLYLTTLSSSLVAFGFLAHTPFALGFLGAIIPVIVLLGAFTYERLVETSLEDVAALAAMQRIRRYYGRLLPRPTRTSRCPAGGTRRTSCSTSAGPRRGTGSCSRCRPRSRW